MAPISDELTISRFRRRVERRAAPFLAAVVARVHHRSLEAGRRPGTLIETVPDGAHEVDRLLAARRHLEALPRQRDRRLRLRRHHHLARYVARVGRHLVDVIERFARLAVEKEQVARLAGDRYRVDGPAVALELHQGRGRRQVAVPDVVPDGLVVPAALAGSDVDGQQAVGEEVVADPRGAVEVGRRRSGRREQQAPPGVERHAGPGVGAARHLQGALGPGLRARLSGTRDVVVPPDQRAVDRAVRGDGARQRVGRLARREAHHYQVLEDDARHRHAERAVSLHGGRQVDDAVLAEVDDRLAHGGIERYERVVAGEEEARRNAALGLALPPHQTALGCALDARVVAPQLFAGARVQGEGDELRRQSVEHPVDDERARVHGGVARPQLA